MKGKHVPIIDKEVTAPSSLKVRIRKLSYKQAKEAKASFQAEAIEQGKRLGELGDRIREQRRKEQIERAEAGLDPLPEVQQNPWEMYDTAITLYRGILGWSYQEELTPENIDNLIDEQDAEFIVKEIVLFSERSADDTKDYSAPLVPISE